EEAATCAAPLTPQADDASPPGAERRTWVRYLSRLQGNCRPVGRNKTVDYWPGRLRDISTGGTRLLMGRRFEPGTLLALELPVAAGEQPRLLLARVVRVVNEGLGEWSHGCSFVHQIAEDDLQTLLSEDPVAPPSLCPPSSRAVVSTGP